MEEGRTGLKIAVVGGGIAGIASAWYLSQRHEVSIIELASRLGGHTNTRMIDDPFGLIPVDTGFIVCNPVNYPNFYQLLGQWGVSLRDSDMSFGYSSEIGSGQGAFGWVGPQWRQFARMPENVLRPSCWKMLFDWRKFNRAGQALLAHERELDVTLGAFLDRIHVGDTFTRQCLIPLAASVWSSPDQAMLDFPAVSFLRFFQNHGLLNLSNFPQWQTIVGGSHAYLKAFESKFTGVVRVGEKIDGIDRHGTRPRIEFDDGRVESYDHVVLATHADVSLSLLKDPSPAELSALQKFTYHQSETVLHTDVAVMPRDRRNWASWNYRRPASATPHDPVPITYHMNRLQGLESAKDYFVTLNARDSIDPTKVLYETVYTHPCFTIDAMQAQLGIHQLNGAMNTHFCGSYMRYGFHEDAVASALCVAKRLGACE